MPKMIQQLIVLFVIVCHAQLSVAAQSVGPPGNRAVGIIKLSGQGNLRESTITILGLEDIVLDRPNEDGVFYLIIPPHLKEFQLIYRAAGYWGGISSIFENNQDPNKIYQRTLIKRDPNDVEQIKILPALLSEELNIFLQTNLARQKMIRSELDKFRGSFPPLTKDKSSCRAVEARLPRTASTNASMDVSAELFFVYQCKAISLINEFLQKMDNEIHLKRAHRVYNP